MSEELGAVVDPDMVFTDAPKYLAFVVAPGADPVIRVWSDGRVEWNGDQSEAARGFWRAVESLCPWKPKEQS